MRLKNRPSKQRITGCISEAKQALCWAHLRSALTTRSATSARVMLPHTVVSSVSTPLPVAGSLFKPPGRTMIKVSWSPTSCVAWPRQGLSKTAAVGATRCDARAVD